MAIEETLEQVSFKDVQVFPRDEMRNGVKESVDLAAGYLICALQREDWINERGPIRHDISRRNRLAREQRDFEKHAKTVGRVLDLNFTSPDVAEGWFSVIHATAVEFLDAFKES